jgi:hypothetical protein
MTPKEKAEELIMKMSFETHAYNAKSCALVAVDERIDEMYAWMGGGTTEWEKDRYNYWQEVKQEIQKL